MTPKKSQNTAPCAALERPSSLKSWSADLVGIVKGQESSLFEGWDFGPGSLTRADFGRILKKMTGCGSVVELRAAIDRKTGEVGDLKVHAANYCGQHTICPYCAGRVQDRRGARFQGPIKDMAVKYPFAYMVTATVPPVPTWREDLQNLIEGWQNFRRMGQKRPIIKKKKVVGYREGRGEFGKVKAGLAKIELKRGAGSGLPHCHYHSLIFTESPLDFQVWSAAEKLKPKEDRVPLYRIPRLLNRETRFKVVMPGWSARVALRSWVPASKISYEWFQATGTATNFRVDPIRYRESDKKAGRSWSDAVYDQSREVLKYATKFDSSPAKGSEKLFASDFVGIRDATYCRRLFITYGDFRKVGGDDFVGGGPHVSTNPIIFESRWRGFEYSPLLIKNRPVFLNTDITPLVTTRLQIMNRALGQVRRMRSAVLASKKHFRETGGLRPAFYIRREYLENGAFNDLPSVLEVPADVCANPGSPETWERWADAVSDEGREFYNSIKVTLNMDSLDRLDGTIEERLSAHVAGIRAFRNSDTYADQVIRLFRETINHSREQLPAPAPP